MTTTLSSHVIKILTGSFAEGGPTAVMLGPAEWEQLWTSARDHCLVPYLHKIWTASGFINCLPPEMAGRFSRARANNGERNRRLMTALEELRSELGLEGIPILLSKGFPVAQACYGDLGLRLMYDLDLLIKSRDRARALGVLRKNGYVPFFQNNDGAKEGTLFWRPKEYVWDAESVFDPQQPHFVELHTRPWEPHWHGFRLECNLDLWEGARLQEVGGIPLNVPSDEKLLVHLAVHYACNVLESSARLMHLLDIVLLMRLRRADLDWGVVLAHIRESAAVPFSLIALCLAAHLGGCDMPHEVRSALEAETPRGIIDWIDRRGAGDAVSMNLRHRDRSLIYFLHWKLAAGWREKAGVLFHSLRSPWLEESGVRRWKSVTKRVAQRLHHLARSSHK